MSRPTGKLWVIAATLVPAIVVVTASTGTARSVERPVDRSPHVRSLLSQLRSESDISAVTVAESRLTESCMRRNGMQYTALDAEAVTAQIRLDSQLEASRFDADGGAGLVNAEGATLEDPNVELAQSLDDAALDRWSDVLVGDSSSPRVSVEVDTARMSVSTTGCLAEARTALFGDLGTWLSLNALPTRLVGEAEVRTYAEPEVQAQVQQWRRCMRRQGVSGVSAPAELGRLVLASYRGGAADSPVESQDAVTAAAQACDARLDSAPAAYSASVSAILTEDAAEVASYKVLIETALSNARRLGVSA